MAVVLLHSVWTTTFLRTVAEPAPVKPAWGTIEQTAPIVFSAVSALSDAWLSYEAPTPDAIKLYSGREPIVTKTGDGWEITFKP